MSIIKFANGRCRRLRQLKEILDYIRDQEKTTPDLTYGFGGVNEEKPFEDMRDTKIWYQKMTGRQYIHFILSFDALRHITPVLAYKVGIEVGSYYAQQYQVLMTTHTNTNNYHCHYVVNTLEMDKGLKFSQSKKDLAIFKEFTNSILEKHGCPPIKKYKEGSIWDSLSGDRNELYDGFNHGGFQHNYGDQTREEDRQMYYWALMRFNEDVGKFLEVPIFRPQDMSSEFVVCLKPYPQKERLIKPLVKIEKPKPSDGLVNPLRKLWNPK